MMKVMVIVMMVMMMVGRCSCLDDHRYRHDYGDDNGACFDDDDGVEKGEGDDDGWQV